MANKIILVLLVVVFGVITVNACDVCGCSIGGASNGLTTVFRKNHFSLGYFGYGFDGALAQTHTTRDRHTVITATLRLSPSQNWYFLATAPYRWNVRHSADGNAVIQGLGDLQFQVHRVFINQKMKTLSLYLDAGLNLKLPTGSFNPKLAEGNLPTNFNVGNNAWSPGVRVNAIITYQSLGLLVTPSVNWNLKNKYDYQFGRQTSQQALLFYNWKWKGSTSLTPYTGWYYEHIGRDIDAEGKYAHGTGASGHFLSYGFNVKFKTYVADISMAHPFKASYANDEVHVRSRWNAQLSYLF